MVFKLSTTGRFYRNKGERERLKEYGFTFQDLGYGPEIEGTPTIEIATVEDLLKFVDGCGTDVIINNYETGPELEIYDDYRE